MNSRAIGASGEDGAPAQLARSERDWVQFVRRHGAARPYDLAAVLGRTPEEVGRHHVPAARPAGLALDFHELFVRWHGRAPRDGEWPPPQRYAGSYEWQRIEHALLRQLY